jgi:hypothetical protein
MVQANRKSRSLIARELREAQSTFIIARLQLNLL